MDNFDELMDLAEVYASSIIDELYHRLLERDFAHDDPEVVMWTAALTYFQGHDNRGDRPAEVLLIADWGEQGGLDRSSLRVMRWRNGALSGSDLAHEPRVGTARTHQPRSRRGLRSRHQAFHKEMWRGCLI